MKVEVAQMVKNLPAMRETQVGYLGREDPLEKENGNSHQYFIWEITWREELGQL